MLRSRVPSFDTNSAAIDQSLQFIPHGEAIPGVDDTALRLFLIDRGFDLKELLKAYKSPRRSNLCRDFVADNFGTIRVNDMQRYLVIFPECPLLS